MHEEDDVGWLKLGDEKKSADDRSAHLGYESAGSRHRGKRVNAVNGESIMY